MRLPLVLSITFGMPAFWPRAHRNDLRVDRGSPPENCTTCGLPSVGDKAIENVFDFFERQAEARTASAKQSGQAMSQALLTSMMPRQVCCW